MRAVPITSVAAAADSRSTLSLSLHTVLTSTLEFEPPYLNEINLLRHSSIWPTSKLYLCPPAFFSPVSGLRIGLLSPASHLLIGCLSPSASHAISLVLVLVLVGRILRRHGLPLSDILFAVSRSSLLLD